jgi:hypothetical protein
MKDWLREVIKKGRKVRKALASLAILALWEILKEVVPMFLGINRQPPTCAS